MVSENVGMKNSPDGAIAREGEAPAKPHLSNDLRLAHALPHRFHVLNVRIPLYCSAAPSFTGTWMTFPSRKTSRVIVSPGFVSSNCR